jgi:hypothetical protein
MKRSLFLSKRIVSLALLLGTMVLGASVPLKAQDRDAPDKSGSPQQIADWINAALAAHKTVTYERDSLEAAAPNLAASQINSTRNYDQFRIDACTMSFTEAYRRQTLTRKPGTGEVVGNTIKQITSSFELAFKDMDPSSIEVSEFVLDLPTGYKTLSPVWGVTIRATNNKQKIHAETTGRKGVMNAVKLVFAERETAQGVASALRRVAEACGGKSG